MRRGFHSVGLVAAYAGATPPDAPAQSDPSVGDSVVNLSWSPAARAAGYEVYRKLDGDPDFGKIADLSAGTTTYQDTTDAGLVRWSLYHYLIRAVNDAGYADSDEKTATPEGVPLTQSLSANPGASSGTVDLSWPGVGVGGAAGFDLYRSDAGEFGTYNLVFPGIMSGSQQDSGLNPWQSGYYYKLVPTNGYGSGGESSPVTAVPPGPPITSGAFTASPVPGNALIDLSWVTADHVDNYDVYYSTNGVDFDLLVNGLTGTTYQHNGLTPWSGTYYYFIRAGNTYGTTDSEHTAGTTPEGPPVPFSVSSFQADTPGAGDATINWPDTPGVSNYSIHRSDSEFGSYSLIAGSIGTGVNTYQDSGVGTGVWWYYVEAGNTYGSTQTPKGSVSNA